MVTADAAAIAGLADDLGMLAKRGARPTCWSSSAATRDPWEAVLDADPSAVELVMIGGDLAYGRRTGPRDWRVAAADPDRTAPNARSRGASRCCSTCAYSVRAQATPPPKFADLRASLIGRDPRVGPIFA